MAINNQRQRLLLFLVLSTKSLKAKVQRRMPHSQSEMSEMSFTDSTIVSGTGPSLRAARQSLILKARSEEI